MPNPLRSPYIPRAYQPLITRFILDHPRCNVFAGMGTGKSVATLTALDILLMLGDMAGPTLVLAPKLVATTTWPEEERKWDHLPNIRVQPITGTIKQRRDALRNPRATVFTINYDNLIWLIETLGDDWPFETVIADESTRLKSFRLRNGGKRAAALGKVAHSKVKRWVNLTGTPSPNGLVDLWGQMWFIDQGKRLGRTFGAFESRWFTQVQVSSQGFKNIPRPGAQEEIQDLIRDVTYSLEASDYFDIAAPIPIPVYVALPVPAMKQYKELEKELFTRVKDHDIEALNAAAKTIKCLQMASGAVYTDDAGNWVTAHDAKLDALESIINEAGGMPVLVAYHFKSDLVRLRKRFPHGKLITEPGVLVAWNKGDVPLLFAHPASAGHGLNLQDGGNIIVFFSHWWDLEQFQQIIERIGPTRQMQAGHPRPVYVYSIIAKGTIDELVVQRRESKKSVQEILMEAMKRR